MFKYQLEDGKNTPHKSKRKFNCPACQKRSVFTRYLDIESKEYLSDRVGICDRIESCGYHLTPLQFLSDSGIESKDLYIIKTEPKILVQTSYVENQVLQATFRGYSSNKLVQFLLSRFSQPMVEDLISKYRIGTSKHFGGGSTVFWQIDNQNRIRGGKVILYNETTGKRSKMITWVHSILKQEDFNLSQCFFGEHLTIHETKPIALVESEKTALIASLYLPHYVWLASGSMQNVSIEKFKSLKGKSIVLFPDTSKNGKAFELWSLRSKELNDLGYNTIVNDLLEKNATNSEKELGCDLADYLLKYSIENFSNSSKQVIMTEYDTVLQCMIDVNPVISQLIQEFNLHITDV